ncbi:AzlC family ABC transporter permease [Thermodesulfobacteriota bacterium]
MIKRLKENKIHFKAAAIEGLRAAWPICLGYIPIGLAFGVLAQKAGLSTVEIGLMSVFVFAGSSQFIAVSMLATGAATTPIVMTTFMVNLRHLLMSSSLAVHLGNAKRLLLSIFSYGVTDESFAVNHAKFKEGNWDIYRALVVNHTANLAWISSSIVGGVGGQFIPEGAFGIDYALSAMFICLLIFQINGSVYVITAIIAGFFSVLLSVTLPGNAYIVIASMAAATLGVVIKRRPKPSQKTSDKGEKTSWKADI